MGNERNEKRFYENGDVFMTKKARDHENKLTQYAMIFLAFGGMAIGFYFGLNGGTIMGMNLERSAWLSYISTHSVDELKKLVDSLSNS